MLNQIKNIKELHQKIEKEQDLTFLSQHLESLEEITKTEMYYSAKSTYYFNLQQYEEAYEAIQEGLNPFSYSFTLHYNGALISFVTQQYKRAFYHFGKAYRYSVSNREKVDIQENVNELNRVIKGERILNDQTLLKYMTEYENICVEVDERIYPFNRNQESIVRKVLNRGTENESLTNMYKTLFFENLGEPIRYHLKTERYLGQEINRHTFSLSQKSTIPVSYIEADTKLEIQRNGKVINYEKSTLRGNQFNYLTFESGEMKFKSNKPVFVGHPIPLMDQPKKKKLVMNLFIDGLSQTYIEQHNLKTLMPRLTKAFPQMYRNTNCYASADWTYPSLAGLATGVDTLTHGQYHPEYVHDFTEKRESLIETIRKAGYFTAAFTGDWRSSPLQGYGSSFNRTVFKNSLGGFGAAELVEETIDHLETFKDKNNYVWLVIPDLHDVADEFYLSINSQVNTPAHHRTQQTKGETSVLSKYDEKKITRYGEELKRIDLHLSLLLHYVQENYNEDEYLIIIHSDHGQGYFVTEEEPFLAEGRTKVPFMLLGDVPNKTSNKLMSNLDIYPTILHLLDIESDADRYHGKCLEDFGGLAKLEALTESYHPGQPYRAVIHTPNCTHHFITKNNINQYGLVDLEDFEWFTIPHVDLSEEDLNEEKQYYLNWILKKRLHIQI